MVKMVELENKHLEAASQLLYKTQVRENQIFGLEHYLSQEQCKELITGELEKKVSSSIVLLDGEKLVAYVIATIDENEIWGNFGWVNLGAWSIEEDYSYYLGLIYEKIGRDWADRKIIRHVFLVYSGQRAAIDRFNELGFAKQQAHGLLIEKGLFTPVSQQENRTLTVRKAIKEDQIQINSFSREIALFQQKSPCFAPVPESYLKSLDDGFSDLTTDDEGTLYVVEKDKRILGYQLYYPVGKGNLLEPENSVELAVSAVSQEARGSGAGLELTQYALNDQINKGKSIFVTDWRCANLLSSKFWKKTGFKPLAFRLYRYIEII